jgi:serine/threonine protein kinase
MNSDQKENPGVVPETVIATERGSISGSIMPSDYRSILAGSGITYSDRSPYLLAGEDFNEAGWLLYISIVRQQLRPLLESILPVLDSPGISFVIPENSAVHSMILEGALGQEETGKIITVRITDGERMVEIAAQLVQITKRFQGPAIPTAMLVGGCVFAEFIPAINPNGLRPNGRIKWPFSKITPEPQHRSKKWLHKRYYLANLLKGDIKGNVYRGIRFKRWYDIQWCLIKQGKANQCFDDSGRTIKDRLEWQFAIHQQLAAHIPLPKAIDLIEDGADTYFITEFIEGVSLYDIFNILQEGTAWFALRKENKLSILNYLLKALEIIKSFHSNGFVHRDLSPVNFIVSNNGSLHPIDIELCYNFNSHQPDPAFTLGTPGYMSPAQSRSGVPCIEDDIYGIGGLLIRAMTGLSPTKFSTNSPEKLYQDLIYNLGNLRIAALICSCLDDDPQRRPSLESIKHNLDVYYSIVLTESAELNVAVEMGSDKLLLRKIITGAIKEFFKYPLLGKEEKWYALTECADPVIANEYKSYSWYPGFNSGAGGVVYCLGLADQQGFDLEEDREIFYQNLNKVKSFYEQIPNDADPGLLNGAAGFCLSYSWLIRFGLIEKRISNFDFIARLLFLPNEQLNLGNGIAGQGLAALLCADLLEFPAFATNIEGIANRLINAQNRDGSWSIKKDNAASKGVKHTGLYYGIAGIAYFLLEYGQRYYNENAKASAIKGLDWLMQHRRTANGHSIWPVNSKNPAVDPWLLFGFSGIAWVFIKAFERLNDDRYKEAAESALLNHPNYIGSNYLSQATGLAGLGEIYLEACRVFNDKRWQDRASHILSFITHCANIQAEDSLYWLDGSDNLPTAGFMTGNSGILHFLLRFNNPDKIGFPLLSI